MPDAAGPPSHALVRRLGRLRSVLALSVVAGLVALAPAAPAAGAQPGNAYHQTNLVSDLPGMAQLTDPDLVNPWGLAAGPTTPAWVADNGTDKATIYPGFVNGSPIQKAGLVVNIPGGAPTGQVFNPTSGFVVRSGDSSGPARFLFDSEAGLVTGWNAGVPPPVPSTQAQVGASVPGAIYKGLAIADTAAGTFLYAADFHNARIDVFDSNFNLVHLSGSFADPGIPRGFAPFNVQEIGGVLYVAYAKQDADAEDEVAGPSLGFVDAYSTNGQLLRHLVERGQLNAPWGLALAPAGFGRFSGALLVGNFGNGRINAYDPGTGEFLGRLRHEDGRPIQIEGLWALRFGNGVTGNPTTLLFTAGIDDEAHGLFGAIEAAG
jgi:uncharacterized protein (TIGR03118 family)